jgi:hypothetical protein
VILDLIRCEVPQFSSASHHGFSNSSGSLAIFTAIRRAKAARYSSVLQMAGCHHARTAVVPLLVAWRVRRGAVNSFWIMPRGI